MKAFRHIRSLYTGEFDLDKPNQAQKIHDAAIVWENNHIVWVGEDRHFPKNMLVEEEIHADEFCITPGFIDCHTHLAFAGNRWNETTQKLKGASYLDIAAKGGGIRSTVKATRNASFEHLKELTEQRLALFVQEGVTTIEVKTGYGLQFEQEKKVLQIYASLNAEQSKIELIPTLLAAHTIPEEYEHNRSLYLDVVCDDIIPNIAREGLAQFCDVFVEKGAFTFDEAVRILQRGKEFGLKPKIHVDQLSNQFGGLLSEKVGAISADHLEYVSDESLDAIKRAGTVAVSLPIATAFLNQPMLPARKIIERGIPLAVASDFNPGSAPVPSLLQAMHFAAILQRMTAEEVLLGVTRFAAKALDKHHQIGIIKPNYKADFTLFTHDSLEELIYGAAKHSGYLKSVKNGEWT